MPVFKNRITALESDRRIPGNILVEVDGARFASLPAERVDTLGLEEQLKLDESRFEELQHAADVEAAYVVAVKVLTAMPRAVQELKRKLRQKGHRAPVVSQAVARLEAAGLLNDEDFARHFTRTRLGRGHGPPRILTDLLSRGVERGLADRAIADVLDDEGIDANEKARALAEKRVRQLGDLPDHTKKRRVLAYLARRGFRGYEVTEMVAEVVVGVHP